MRANYQMFHAWGETKKHLLRIAVGGCLDADQGGTSIRKVLSEGISEAGCCDAALQAWEGCVLEALAQAMQSRWVRDQNDADALSDAIQVVLELMADDLGYEQLLKGLCCGNPLSGAEAVWRTMLERTLSEQRNRLDARYLGAVLNREIAPHRVRTLNKVDEYRREVENVVEAGDPDLLHSLGLDGVRHMPEGEALAAAILAWDQYAFVKENHKRQQNGQPPRKKTTLQHLGDIVTTTALQNYIDDLLLYQQETLGVNDYLADREDYADWLDEEPVLDYLLPGEEEISDSPGKESVSLAKMVFDLALERIANNEREFKLLAKLHGIYEPGKEPGWPEIVEELGFTSTYHATKRAKELDAMFRDKLSTLLGEGLANCLNPLSPAQRDALAWRHQDDMVSSVVAPEGGYTNRAEAAQGLKVSIAQVEESLDQLDKALLECLKLNFGVEQ